VLTVENRLLLQLLIGLLLSTAIAAIARRRRALTGSGVLGAVLVGTVTFGFGGWVWGLVLVSFFALSSALSRYRQADKRSSADKFQKGAQRDWGQVLANGGLAALLSLVYAVNPMPALLAAFLGAMAAVNADTWGTEIGILSPYAPRLITSGQRVAPGTSGGITFLGTAASAMGGVFIGLLAYVLLSCESLLRGTNPLSISWVVPTALIGGLAGSLFDSLLGATVQGMYYCARCAEETEKTQHRCGLRTTQLRGVRWINNDVVNVVSSLCGALVAVAVWGVFGR
jgi:uncharacterized protein (TIGR00297 family)